MGDFYPAIAVLQLLAGLALATAICRRIAVHPHGPTLGPLREFRFTEHLGWAVAIPLVIVLVPKLAAAKAAAANLLLVAGTLYALRGVAVAAFGLSLLGGGGVAAWIVGVVITFILLPILLGGAIVLGVMDAGLDFRRRLKPQSGE
jgi:uncharacterized protein YybS (DUF2232 family)